jgi:hypothetical protein
MKLLTRIFFLILTIVCGFCVVAVVPDVIASFRRQYEVAVALGVAVVPFILFSVFLFCYIKLQPNKDDANPSAPQITGG